MDPSCGIGCGRLESSLSLRRGMRWRVVMRRWEFRSHALADVSGMRVTRRLPSRATARKGVSQQGCVPLTRAERNKYKKRPIFVDRSVVKTSRAGDAGSHAVSPGTRQHRHPNCSRTRCHGVTRRCTPFVCGCGFAVLFVGCWLCVPGACQLRTYGLGRNRDPWTVGQNTEIRDALSALSPQRC